MITKDVLLFLGGAGASCPYGFPTGKGLVAEILKLSSSTIKNLYGFSEDEITSFRDCLYYSGLSTIDEFIRERKDFKDIAKACLANVIIDCEHKTNYSDVIQETGTNIFLI